MRWAKRSLDGWGAAVAGGNVTVSRHEDLEDDLSYTGAQLDRRSVH